MFNLVDNAQPATPTNGAILFRDTSDKRVKTIDNTGRVNVLYERQSKNYIVNGGFDFAQRQTPGTKTTSTLNTTGRQYDTADRWGVTNQATNVQFSRIDTSAAPETNLVARYYGKYNQITSVSKAVISQPIEGKDTMALRGRKVLFTAKMKYSVAASMKVRLGLIQNNSAATLDTIAAVFATLSNTTGVDPTWGTNLAAITPLIVTNGAIVGNAMDCTLTNAWVQYSATFLVPSNCVNLIPVIFNDAQMAVNDELNISEVGLYIGEEIVDWNPDPHSIELQKCQRFYTKTFPIDTPPAQTGGLLGALRGMVAIAGAVATSSVMQWVFPVRMRVLPTVITFYNPSAGNAFVRNIPAATDATATATASTSDLALDVNCTGLAGWTVGQELKVNATASAEI